MINELMAAFESILQNTKWMDQKTQTFARQKVRATDKKIGFPDFVLEDQKLTEYYSGVS